MIMLKVTEVDLSFRLKETGVQPAHSYFKFATVCFTT